MKNQNSIQRPQYKTLILWVILALIILIGFYTYVNYLKHRCDSLCVTIFNSRGVPVLFEKQGINVLVGTGSADGSLIGSLGRRLPFYEKDIDILVVLDSASSTLIGIEDIYKKYTVGTLFSATSSDVTTSVTKDLFKIKTQVFKSLSRAKNAKDKKVIEVSVFGKRFVFDVDTTISQKQFGFGNAEIIFMKNISITKAQEKHAISFAEKTNAAHTISTSQWSDREVKFKRLFEVLEKTMKTNLVLKFDKTYTIKY